MSVLVSTVPEQKTNQCGELTPIPCDSPIKTRVGTGNLEIAYPTSIGSTLSLSGGVILKIDISNMGINPTNEVASVINSRLSSLTEVGSGLTNSLESLVEARNSINDSLFQIRNIKIITENGRIKAPDLFYSLFIGDDSDFVNNIANPNINKVCEFSFIPTSAITRILENIVQDGTGFENVVGTSGRTFGNLRNAAQSLDESEADLDLIDLVLEIFPLYNISEDSILNKRSEPVIGGFYTVFNDNIYVKMPDISGKDSAGFSSDIYTEDDVNLYIELLNGANLSRMKIENFKAPPEAAVIDYTEEFPLTTESVIIELDTTLNPSDIVTGYLSILAKGANVSNNKPLETFDNGAEIFSIPMLTKTTVGVTDGLPTVEGALLGTDQGIKGLKPVSSVSDILSEYFTDFDASDFTVNEIGIPIFSAENTNIFFGEKTRAEIVLADRDKDRSLPKNDRRYFRPQAYGALELLAQNRPRIYGDKPQLWIRTTKIGLGTDGTGLEITFDASSFSNINISSDTLSGEVEFALYLEDSLGQISRVAGRNIILSTPVPSISSISPSGFSGGGRILADDSPEFIIEGTGLANAQFLRFTASGTASSFELALESEERYTANTSLDERISINFIDTLGSIGFNSDTVYEVRVAGLSGELSSSFPIFVSLPEQALPAFTPTPIEFLEDEFSVPGFGRKPVIGIPLTSDGNHAEITIRSKQKLFLNSNELFLYLAFNANDSAANSALAKFSPGRTSTLVDTKINQNIVIAKNIEYEFVNAPSGDFVRLTNKDAVVRFPGNNYANYNFSDLINLDKAYFVITEQRLDAFEGAEDGAQFTLNDSQYGIIELGDGDTNPFIRPPIIKCLFARIPGQEVISSTLATTDSDIVDDIFGGTPIEPSGINAFEKIKDLAIVFEGIDDGWFIKKKYTFKLGSEIIDQRIVRKIQQRDNGTELLAVFSNINTLQEGILNVAIEKREKRFNTTLSSEKSINQATVILKSGNYEFDEDGFVNTNIEISEVAEVGTLEQLTTGAFISGIGELVDNSKVMDLLIPSFGNGIQINRASRQQEDFHNFFNPISLTPNVDIEVNTGEQVNKTIARGTVEESISDLSRSVFKIPLGTIFVGSDYEINDETGDLLGFIKATVDDPATIKFNVPEVTAISISGGDYIELKELRNGETIPIPAGSEIGVEVVSSKRNFVIKLGELFTLNTKGKPERISKGKYRAVVKVPVSAAGITVDSTGSCFEICASTTNNERLGAKFDLGTQFVIDVDQKMEDLLFGPTMDKIPDIGALRDQLEDTPLRFVQFVLDKSMVAGQLIHSFCDLSFNLTAELKVSLNGLRLIMIPIQVIFCIIDVICALLNPVKIARAVIRLFECLYDLILLLPQISVPVMFLQLVLHLLELIQCLIEKILFTVNGINATSAALFRAVQDKNWVAIKNLEEVLSQYLFSIESDLQVLEPILSIFSIFLELMQLVFRFPCSVDPGGGDPACGLDGSMLAGVVAGIIAPNDVVEPNALIPIAQAFTNESIEDAASSSNGSEPYEEPSPGDKVGEQDENTTFVGSMDVDTDTLRSTNFDFNVTYAPTFTKMSKGFGDPRIVKMQFNGRGRNGTFRRRKVVDPLQTLDDPLQLLVVDGGDLEIRTTGKGNFVSPIDSFEFITIDDDKGTVKPLELTFDIPILEVNEETGEVEETGVNTIVRTFDDIPSMAIMDEEINLYFIEPDGIVFDNDDNIKSIKMKMQNFPAASKIKFSKEDQEIDTDGDGDNDDETGVFDFPQFYFVDMRQAQEEIQQACYNASLNSFLIDEDNTEDIINIIEEGQECLDTFLEQVRGVVSTARNSLNSGQVPDQIDVQQVQSFADTFTECFEDTSDKMCRFVVNTLNTSFRVSEDDDFTPLSEFPDVEVDEDLLDGFESDTPALTGAREYASGIGDSATIGLGEEATIVITPRDSYDVAIGGDLSKRIVVEIISDTTGDAELVRNEDGNLVETSGDDYILKLTANSPGEVKIRAKICDRTIQAVTFDGTQDQIEVESNVLVDCVPDSLQEATGASPALGALAKIDRILTVFFVRRSRAALSMSTEGGTTAIGEPQEFGTSLEN